MLSRSLLVIVALVAAGCATVEPRANGTTSANDTTRTTPVATNEKPPPQVHYHAFFRVFVDGERATIVDPKLFFDNMARDRLYLPAHVHQCNPELLHNEARQSQAHFWELFSRNWADQGGNLSADRLVVPRGMTQEGLHHTDATHALRLLVSSNDTAWTPRDVMTYTFENKDRILLVYGAPDEDVAPLEDAFPTFASRAPC